MKVVIFAGGKGTRISEESHLKPKPMIEIGGKPILWHIMKIYEKHGFTEFILCLGYKGNAIKEYFVNYFSYNADITIELQNNTIEVHHTKAENFKVTLVDTGLDTMTAGRLQRVEKYIQEDTFMLTYGDGVADVNISELVDYHHSHGKLATMTAIIPEGRFGTMDIAEDGIVNNFKEKPKNDNHWINGGFFVLNKEVFKYLNQDMTDIMWEEQPLIQLTADKQLMTFKHHGFWKCMDAMRDKEELEKMWDKGNAPWKIW
ncbi:glucose-1-phosphate cytidylyltransferase [Flavobacterium branchiophilum]|uniref:Probable glucose-1-phosphate cytidylyltransferase n=1 Tax=Flavobacterium branchiophilum (strain FL-15) TaxID=1034807 RepID=G2Z6L7_FLABF|nr:glucose-1-phosphate cytidylyltransferase [Flavobacterium branchiophilum]CCB68859.1 Probable glucose-1-phosphate cytidylyltransferase [Flavobacterium branchiophilum FL-15]